MQSGNGQARLIKYPESSDMDISEYPKWKTRLVEGGLGNGFVRRRLQTWKKTHITKNCYNA